MKPDTEKVLSILAAHENNAANLIAILQDVQAEYNYLSEANLTLIADALDISVSRVYSVATFYENFSLEAKGKHIIKVCAGTACHVRKSGPIYDAVYEYLGLSGKKKTSDDGLFTLETVACLGACGLAPVLTVNGLPVKSRSGGDVHLAADDRFDPRRAGRTVKIDHTVHDTVIGDRHAVHAEFLRPGRQLSDFTGSVQKTVLCMDVQVCKCHLSPPFLSHLSEKDRRPERRQSRCLNIFFYGLIP